MKKAKVILILALILSVAVSSVFAVNKNNKERSKTNYESIYRSLLNEFYNIISNGIEEANIEEGKLGVMEAVIAENTLNDIGYRIEDISGDGIPELIIGSISESKDYKNYGSNIFAVYTYKNDKAILVFESTQRSMYSFMNDGKFLYQGSAGAVYNIFGVYKLSKDGEKLICNDYYFTYEKDKTYQEIGFYYNTSGEFDKSVSEELNISRNEFENINSNLRKDIKSVEFTPFSKYK